MKNKIYVTVTVAIMLLLCFLPWFVKDIGKTDRYEVVVFGDSIATNVYSSNSIGMFYEELSGRKTLTAAFGGTTMSDSNHKHDPGKHYGFLCMVELSECVRDNDFSFCYMSTFKDSVFELPHYPYTAERLMTVDWSSVSYIIIEQGVNDYTAGIYLDNPDDPNDVTTFGGALRTSIKNIKKGAPNATLILMTPIYNRVAYPEDCLTHDYGGGCLEDYVNKELEIAKELGIAVIDNFHNSGIGPDNFDIYTVDNLHINEEGTAILAQSLYECIMKLEGNSKE